MLNPLKPLIATILAVQVCCVAEAGGSLFFKPAKSKPAQERVPELINLLRTNADESIRADAAEELRQFDPALFPEIIPSLVDSLLTDKKAGVRAECASSLGKLKGVHAKVGQALEHAMANDSSMRVRLQCRSSLFTYQLSGYRSTGKPTAMVQTTEPPIANAVANQPEPPRQVIMPAGRPTPLPGQPLEKQNSEKQPRGILPDIGSWFRKSESPAAARRESQPAPVSPSEPVDGPELGMPR